MDIGLITPDEASASPGPEAFSLLGSSGIHKHQRSVPLVDTWHHHHHQQQPPPSAKVSKTDSFYIGQSLGSLRSGSGISSNNNGQSMICFSSQPQIFADSECGATTKSSTFPFFLCSPKPTSTNPGYQAEKTSAGIHGPFSKFRGPFTPSQWMELEHQAMIYKHFISNIPVPSHLLIPIRKAFSPYAFSGLSSGSYGSGSWGWGGSLRVGFGGSSDPEPGRCRRTDGKKWRCARDAVHDQKYCERHLNRGRHRSRKPVEGQLGHALSVSSSATKTATNDVKSSALVLPTSKLSDSFGTTGTTTTTTTMHHHQFESLQPNPPPGIGGSCDPLSIRMQDLQALPEETPLSSEKQHTRFGGSVSDFGLVSPDSLLNPSCRNSDFGLNDQERHDDQYPLRHFIDNWPKDQSNQSSSWSEELKMDWTQLSMSIPVSASDFSTSQNSLQHLQEAEQLPTLKLSSELDAATKMELDIMNEPKESHTNWLPLSWGRDSVGGPLGEALNNGSNIVDQGLKNSPAIGLVSDPWDNLNNNNNNNHPQMGFSPTGVLQKSSFLSRSSSSSGNSPGTGNNKAH